MKCSAIGRCCIILCLIFFTCVLCTEDVRADEFVPVDSQVSVSTDNARSISNRRTRLITSTVDVTLTNISERIIQCPIHAVIQLYGADPSVVQVPGASGGSNILPYNTYYFEISPGAEFLPNQSYTFNIQFIYSMTVRFTYEIIPYAAEEISNIVPTANAGPDQSHTLPYGSAHMDVTLHGSGSDPDGNIVAYTWTGSPDPEDEMEPTLSLPEGTYEFSLVVTDDDGADSNADTVRIIINPSDNQRPVANAGSDNTVMLPFGYESTRVSLDGNNSYDPEGGDLLYSWSGDPVPDGLAQPVVTLGPGVHTFTLTVTDVEGLDSAPVRVTITVTAEDSGNPPELILDPSEFTVREDDVFDFTIIAHDPDADLLTITAAPRLKNSSFSVIPGIDAAGTFSFSPDYTQAGDYSVLFKTRDPLGNTASMVARIHVTNLNRDPWLTVEPDTYNMDEGDLLTVQFNAGDPDDDPVNLSINGLPESNAVFLPITGTLTFAPDYDQAGEYTVTCTVDDGTADPVSKSIHITVNDVPVSSQQPNSLDLQVDQVQSPTLLATTRITGTVNADISTSPSRLTAAVISGMNPVSAMPGETLDVQLTGAPSGDFATHFVQGISQADFGSNIAVNKLTVTGPDEAIANITIDAAASTGYREVKIVTDYETAMSVPAFTVTSGSASISGVVTDPDTGLPVAGALITLQGTDLSTVSGADGTFTLTGAPTGEGTLIINAPDHELITIDVDAQSGVSTDLGSIETTSIVYDPDAPPAATLASVVNRGLGVSESSLTVDEAKQLIIDTILTIGGSEAGVLDEYGNQLNPLVDGNGLVSLKDSGANDLALQLIAGDTHTLGDILFRYLRIFNYNGNTVPRLTAVLAAIQNEVDRAWLSPGDGSGLFVVLFNQRRQLLGNPPQINMDTPLNALQTYIMVTSLLVYTHNTLNAVEYAVNDFKPVMLASSGMIFSDAPMSLLMAQTSGSDFGDIYSMGWDMVFETASPDFASMIKDGAVEVCRIYTTPEPPPTCGNGTVDPTEECDGDPGCTSNCEWAIKDVAPGCSEMADLVEMLLDDQGDAATGASERFSGFFMSEGATRETADRIKAQYQSTDFQEAWEESKKDARALGKLEALTEFGASFVMDGLTKMAGDIVSSILAIQVDLIIENVRPDPPMIYKVEQLPDPTIGELTNTVRVTFRRSMRDKGKENAENQNWFYELWRQKGGKVARVTSGSVRKPNEGPGPRPTDDPNKLVFYDYEVPEGSLMYYVRAVRMIGPVIADPQPTAFDTVLQMAGGLFPLDFATPGGTTVMGGDTLKMLLDPVSQIIKGIQIQKSRFSDPDILYVSLKPRPPAPPANLASVPVQGTTYMSIPALSRIFSIEDGDINLAAESGFISPHQAGLAVDRTGNLYTDNAASDHQYGGRVFKFDHETMGRTLTGTVNYYSSLLGYAHPVMVQAMAIGPSPYGEALYIADAMDNRVTRLQLPESLPAGFNDMSRNVSRNYIRSDKFSFGTDTAMAFRGDGTLYITQADNILSIPYGGEFVEPLFDEAWAPTPFNSLTGIAIDEASNLYVSDGVQNTITQLPFGSYMAGSALKGYDSIALKKLTIARGFVRPGQLQLSHNRRGLTFIDANGLHSVNFGMSGQITDTSGNPLIGAKIIATDTIPTLASITDGDGIFVFPDLVSNTKNVVDITIRYDNRTYSERVILDPFRHNVVDFVFDPKSPPAGTDPLSFSSASSVNTVNVDLNPGSTRVISEQVTVPKALPSTTPPVPDDYFPRSHIMTPADEMVVTDEQIDISGFLTDTSISDAFLVVNGERISTEVLDGEVSETVNLTVGDNTIALGTRVGGPRGELIEAMGRANETVRMETTNLHPWFGAAMSETGALAGRSARVQLGEVIPEAYRPAAAVTERAAQVEQGAAVASEQLFQGHLPEDAAMSAIVDRAAEFAAEAGAKAEGMAVGASETNLELAANAQNNVREAREKLETALPNLHTFQNRFDVDFSNINAFLGSQTAAAAVRQGAQAFSNSNSVVFGEYQQYHLPDTPVAHELTHIVQMLSESIDTALESDDYSDEEETALSSFRNLVIEINDETQSLHQDLAPRIGEAVAQAGMLQGMSVAEMGAAMNDSSVPEALRQEAVAFSTEAEAAVQGLADAELPRIDHLAALSTRADTMAAAAQAADSGISAGFCQAIQHRITRSNDKITSANNQFGQARASLETSHSGVVALRAQVDSMAPEARPAAFADIADDYDSVHGAIRAGLNEGRLPAAAQVGSAKTGDRGALQQRQGQMDEMFTVISIPVQVRRAKDAVEADTMRRSRGFDTVITGRLKDTDTGYPVGGLELGVPGVDGSSGATDQDGVFRIQIDLNRLQAKVEEMNTLILAKHDLMMSVIGNIQSGGGTLTANEGLATLILESTKIQDAPPAALAQRSEIVSTAAEIERRSTIALADVEAGRPLGTAQVLEIESEIEKLATMATQLQAVIETRHNVGMSIITNIK